MSRIKCESCGKIYTYQDNEFCPKCGAYNPQEPRKNYRLQEPVFDETEITMDTEEVEFDEEEPKAQSEEVEKFLRDAAHLVGRDDPEAMCQEQGVDMEALNNMTQKQVKVASKVVKLFSEWNKIGIVVFAIFVLFGLISNGTFDRIRYALIPQSEYSYEEPEYKEVRHGFDESFNIDGVEVTILEAEIQGNQATMQLMANGLEEGCTADAFLYWFDDDGEEQLLWADEMILVDGSDCVWTYKYDISLYKDSNLDANADGYYIAIYAYWTDPFEKHLVRVPEIL